MTLFQDQSFVAALSDALGYTAKSIRACSPSRQADLLRELQAKAPDVAARLAGKGTPPAAQTPQQPAAATAGTVTLQDATVEQLVECLVRRAKDLASLDAVLDMVCVAGQARADQLKAAAAPVSTPAAATQKPTAETQKPGASKPQASKPAVQQPTKPAAHPCPAPGTELPAPPVKKPEQLVTLPATSNPDPKPAPKPLPTPKVWQDMLAMAKEDLHRLASHHGIDLTLPVRRLQSQVWAKVKPADAAAKQPASSSKAKGKKAAGKAAGKPAAAQKSAARTTADAAKPATPPAPVDPVVDGVFGADGKPLTLSQVMAALAKLKPAGK